MIKEKFEPWTKNPLIWKTEAKYWAWLRGNLRRSLWEKNPIKITFKNAQCSPPPKGVETRAKTGAYCALEKDQWVGKSKLQCDHIIGNVSLKCVDDILPFVMHLLPQDFNNLQLVGKEAHTVKSYAERYNITYEEAKIRKRVIQLVKLSLDKQNKQLLQWFNADDISNAAKRKRAYTTLVKDGKIR